MTDAPRDLLSIGAGEVSSTSQCPKCSRYWERAACEAPPPGGIPDGIWEGTYDHTEPHPIVAGSCLRNAERLSPRSAQGESRQDNGVCQA